MNFAVIAKNKPAPKSRSCVGCPHAMVANWRKNSSNNSILFYRKQNAKKETNVGNEAQKTEGGGGQGKGKQTKNKNKTKKVQK